jgi:DNA-3-methyladenine glycosylase I
MAKYHDEEWGVPVYDDDRLFELLTLEGAQAGLSWDTVLKKRDAYRVAFLGFAIDRVAEMSNADVEVMLGNAGLIRHRGKLESTISNARAAQAVQSELGSFSTLLWSFVGMHPVIRRPATVADLPATSAESDAMSKELRRRGFKFVGSTICYAFMQASGMIDDHVVTCFRAAPRT